MRFRPLLLGLLLTILMLAGCASGGDGGDGPASEEPATDESPAFEMVAPPGSYSKPDGTTQVLGILTYRDLEGGFWAVAKTAIPEEAATAEILAVIMPQGEDLEKELQALDGEYVSVVGRLNEGPSIYMAGPLIEAQTVEIVSDTAVE